MLDSIPHSSTTSVSAALPAHEAHEPAHAATGAIVSNQVGASDEVSISLEGLAALQADDEVSEESQGPGEQTGELTDEEREQVRELQRRDIEVRSHEQAHLAAAGNLAAGGPSYETQRGPDGRQYAVGGEVDLRTTEGRTPEESLRIARQVQRAALAPAQPSGQDRAVAAGAAQQAAAAQAEIAAERQAGADSPSEAEPLDAAGDEAEGGEPVAALTRRHAAYAGAGEQAAGTSSSLGSVMA